MKSIHLIVVSTLCLSFALISSCKKQKQEDSAEMSQQNALAEDYNNELQNMLDEASNGSSSFQTYTGDCVTLDYDTTGGTTTITIDFGTTNCLCDDGRERRGKVICTYSGNYFALNNPAVVTTENYFVDDNEVSGTRTSSFTDTCVYSISSDFEVTMADGSGSFTWESDRTRTQTEGKQTLFVLTDNVYEINGTASGETVSGKDYLFTTTENLVIQLGCRHIKAGVLTLSSSTLKTDAVLDYGDGTCDNKAILTYDGKEKEITL